MRSLILLSIIIISFTSCSRYQYFTLQGSNISKSSSGEFVAENDTMRVTYNFNGQGGPVWVSVYNKTDKSLQVDWKRSALIINGNSVSYFSPDMKLTGEVERPTSRFSNSAISGTLSGSEAIEFIAPRASVSRQSLRVSPGFLKNPEGEKKEEVVRTQGGIRRVLYKTYFTEENSPVKFRSYLTMEIDGKHSFSTDHEFYVTETYQTGAAPASLEVSSGDQFYLRKKSTAGLTAVSLGLMLGVAVFAAGM